MAASKHSYLFDLDEGFRADQRSHDGQHNFQRSRRSNQDHKFHILPEGVAHLPVARCQPARRNLVLHAGARIEKHKDVRALQDRSC